MAHLSHKIPWHLIVEYLTPYHHSGIKLPVGACDKIHVNSKIVELQVKNRNYINEDDVCTDGNCVTKPEKKVFSKKTKKAKIFGQGLRDSREDFKRDYFNREFEKVIMEFANTELNTPREDVKYDESISDDWYHDTSLSLTSCHKCNRFIRLLEFGDKNELFKYSDEELEDIFSCQHGGQAVGNSLRFLMYHVSHFYLMMNVILYCNLKEEDWPASMKPGSYFRESLLYACDGQTFLPHSRKYLPEAMINAEVSRTLSKNLFRFIYFFVMMQLKIDKNYSLLKYDAYLIDIAWR